MGSATTTSLIVVVMITVACYTDTVLSFAPSPGFMTNTIRVHPNNNAGSAIRSSSLLTQQEDQNANDDLQLTPDDASTTDQLTPDDASTTVKPTPDDASTTAEPTPDDASTTAQLLFSLWEMVVSADEMGRGEEKTVVFPNMAKDLASPTFMARLMNHLDVCKDVCDDFGISILLMPYQHGTSVTQGFTVKSYSDPLSSNSEGEVDETGGYLFENDEYWDDDFDFKIDPEMLKLGRDGDDDDYDHGESVGDEMPLPDDEGVTDDAMIATTKDWVNTMMSNMGICPFTSGPDMAGLPLGKVFYTVDRVSKTEHVYASYWRELVRMESSSEKDLSTTLLLLPNFSMQNVELFENLGTTLTQPLEPLALEDLTQLVFFHPRWTFRDGGDRAGGDTTAANYARRSSWPMINLLRTTQVRAAQRGIPTGLVYTQNEKTLSSIGSASLEDMLRTRNWDPLADTKVNRREHDALALARDMQDVIQDNSTHNNAGGSSVDALVQESVNKVDQNAAVNKVDRSQIDGGDLVNVLRQALEKRLEGDGLSGAETSATMMAGDFLIEELDRILAAS